MTISCWIIRMRDVSIKSCTENQNTHFTFSNFSPRKSWRLWECRKMLCSRRPHMTIWRRTAFRIIRATRAQSYPHPPTHTHTRICNTFCFSTVTTISCTRLVTSYVHCLSSVLFRRYGYSPFSEQSTSYLFLHFGNDIASLANSCDPKTE